MQSSQFLLTLGGILLLGLVTSHLGRITFLPRVTLLLIFGIIIGKEMLDIIPTVFFDLFETLANMALLMVGFLLGGKLTMDSLRCSAGKVLWISLSTAIITTIIVTLGLIWLGTAKEIAILLGCFASATAPAAVLDVVMESDDKTPFQNMLLSIVALDDIWALMLFAIGIALVSTFNGHADNLSPLLSVTKEITGAILLGILLGLPSAYLTGRIKPGQPILMEALGLVFVCGGLALWFNVSFLIASMVLGAVIANFAKHHEYPFHSIEGIEWPFMVIFFVLAGATLEFSSLTEIGLIGIAYILFRSAGKILGARIGGQFANADQATKKWMGVALLPQAGVAIGMALVASNHFPEYSQLLLSIVITSTIFFELIGPVFTRLALNRTHHSKRKHAKQ
ncbi:MAG: cation:proton antiporter [Gammaproteobacteria bacterium]|nr:cation:proton antiporter [Gammaproteobacteria bacterium]